MKNVKIHKIAFENFYPAVLSNNIDNAINGVYFMKTSEKPLQL